MCSALSRGAVFFLPPEGDFNCYLVPILSAVFGLKAAAILLPLIEQLSMDVFVVDWEDPDKRDVPMSNRRRILVANQWNRIYVCRSYNIVFTLCIMTFLIDGVPLELLATPIPHFVLVDMGIQYLVLKLTLSSILWFIVIAI
jgi:hypothetical protein